MNSLTFSQRKIIVQTKISMKTIIHVTIIFFCLLLFTTATTAQNEKLVTIKGTITSESGEPLPGVSIIVKGTAKGTTAKPDGSFEIDAPTNATLLISYVGYGPQEIKTGSSDQSNLKLQLLPEKDVMDQIIVVGYGTRKKSDVTGAITSIREQQIKDIPAANLAQAMQGQGAGVDIVKSGGNNKPGSTPSILIRGTRSVRAGNSPLIVVDGIPYIGNLNDLNQNDVVSIEVLKDASSTAIYGSRGANGVILVNTKRGKAGRPVVSYEAYAGTSRRSGEYNVMNGEQFALFKKWAFANGIYSGNTPKYTGIDDPRLQVDGLSAEEQEGIRIGRNTNWQDLIYTPGSMTNHQLAITGGTDITQYAFSGGYYKEKGIYPGQDFERYSVKASLDQQLGKIFKVGINSLNTFTTTNGEGANPMAAALRSSPLASPYDSAGRLVNAYVPGSASQVWNVLGNFLPGASVEKRKRFGTFTTLYVDVNIAKGLKYKFNAGTEIRSDVYGNFYAAKTTNNQGSTSSSSNRTVFRTNIVLENILTYDKTFGGKHKINFTGLYSWEEQKVQSNRFSNTGLLSDDLQYFNPSLGANLVGEGSYDQKDILSYMARANYSFNDKYMLTLTVRSDGFSSLAPGNKWHTYPSAAVGWNIFREDFLSGIRFLSALKLRGSYGSVGNANINPYQTLGALSGIVYNYGGTTTTGVYPTDAPNPKLSWEYTNTVNIGMDFGFFGNRMTGSIEFYKQFTHSLLLPQALPPTTGIPTSILTNIGATENKGFEFNISTVNVAAKNKDQFNWTTDLNIFINRGKITKLANGVTRDVANSWFVGQPVGVFYDYQRVGIWQNTREDTLAAQALGLTINGAGGVIGQIRVADLSGPQGKPDGKIDATYDRMIVGTTQPKWEGGMTNRFSYSGFELTVFAFARVGNTISSTLQGGAFVNTFQGTYNNLNIHYWTPTNHENYWPRPNANYTNTPNQSVLRYYDGTFLKIKTISLGYNLPATVVNKLHARNIKIYATAENPCILFSPYIKKYDGLDPETVSTLDIDTPPNRTFVLGVNVSF